MSALRKWDVVLLAYPFTDRSATKVRPAVVISPDAENGALDDAVFLLITSNVTRRSAFDVVIDVSHPEFSVSGLKVASAIRVNKMLTLHEKLFHRKLGRLGPQLQEAVMSRLAEFLEIERV